MKYCELLVHYKDKYTFLLYHYVLMTNHVHLVVETTDQGLLSQIMKGINLSYAQYYKKKYGHVGHFWQDRYKSILISKDEYLLACGSYVELNPVRAGMVKAPGNYRWSSYTFYAHGQDDPFTDIHPVYCALSSDEKERRKGYQVFVQGMLEKRNAMKGEMERRRVYGNEAFAGSIANEYKTGPEIKSKGRPRKVKIAEK